MKEFDYSKINIDNQVEMLIAAYESIFIGKAGIYVSTPITTGKRLVDLLLKNGVRHREELKRKLGDHEADLALKKVTEENIQSGEELTTYLKNLGLTNVINPARFQAVHFEQDHYNHFWAILIERKICSVYFNHNWEYSHGCRTEYLATIRHNVPAHDETGKPLSSLLAITKLNAALRYLIDNKFPIIMQNSLVDTISMLQEQHVEHR